MKIEGSVALVTGANRGIGKAISTALLERGAAKVYAAVRDATTVPTDDPRLVPVPLDVTDAAQVRAVAAALGDVEIVVNNAGIGRPATPLTASVDDARAELEVNYLPLLATTQAFAPTLAANGGGAATSRGSSDSPSRRYAGCSLWCSRRTMGPTSAAKAGMYARRFGNVSSAP